MPQVPSRTVCFGMEQGFWNLKTCFLLLLKHPSLSQYYPESTYLSGDRKHEAGSTGAPFPECECPAGLGWAEETDGRL